MLYIALLLAVVAVYFAERKIYEKHIFENLTYNVTVGSEEVFEGEDIYVFEEITNDKMVPMPYAKVDTTLPSGLAFRITENDAARGTVRDSLREHIQSVFVLKSREKVRRRWRVNCKRRGVYSIGDATVVANDIFGMNPASEGFHVEPSRANTVVVLPKAINLEEHFTSTYYHSGDVIKNHSLLTDQLLRRGTREYTVYDPMNSINWKQTAAHGRLLVNESEYTQRHRFNIMINMNSRDIEKDSRYPASPDSVELCITVAASILDRISQENVPVRIISNTPPAYLGEGLAADSEGIGRDILFTGAYEGKRDMIEALRLLAAIKVEMSCPIEKLLDYVLLYHKTFAESGNLIFISSYISERMIIFHNEMQRCGVNVIFYVTTTNRNTANIPSDVEVYYKTHTES
ncbi:MAG: DUF58 domain-containing protein [Firmicutes bacterium]|nr:DUF58 domain-containing protein [Bacillota bacterium]